MLTSASPLKKGMLLILAVLATGKTCLAMPQGHGRVNMQGTIVDSACAIDTGSREQRIDMGTLPVSQIQRDGHGNKRPFSIYLINCIRERSTPSRPDWKAFKVTFDGQQDGKGFGVEGKASGVFLQISDAEGYVANPGKPLPRRDIHPGTMRLDYYMTLVANSQPLKAGDYFSVIRFKLDYF